MKQKSKRCYHIQTIILYVFLVLCAIVIVKLINKSRGAAEFFYLGHPDDPNEIVKFKVFRKTWYEAKVGDTILVWQKAGYLNIPYIKDFEVKKDIKKDIKKDH
jgi:hypothetical protein